MSKIRTPTLTRNDIRENVHNVELQCWINILVIFMLVLALHGRLFPLFSYPRLLLKTRLLSEIDIPVFEHWLLRCGCFVQYEGGVNWTSCGEERTKEAQKCF